MIDRVIILDPKLIHEGGHHYISTSELYYASQRMGLPCVVLVNKICSKLIIDELEASPVFSHHLWSKVNAAPGYESMMQWVGRNLSFERELKQLSHMTFSSHDLVILQTSSEMNLFGLYQWYCELDGEKPKISITLHAPEFCSLDTERGISRELFRKTVMAWSRLAGNDVVIGATSKNLAVYLKKLTNANAVYVPHIIKKTKIISQDRDPGSNLTVVCPGDFRKEKGYSIIGDTLEAYRAELKNFKFIIQVSADGEHSDKEARRFQAENVELVRGILSGDQYLRMLQRADATLAFYYPPAYALKISGVLDESIAMGLPVITTRGTTMAERLAELQIPGIVAQAWTKDALYAALMQLSAHYPALKAATLRAAAEPGWQGADKFLDFTIGRLT